jgi:hypothetical protein
MRDPDGILVHSQTCLQNVMIDISIASAGGQVFAYADWETAFAQAAAHMGGMVDGRARRGSRCGSP